MKLTSFKYKTRRGPDYRHGEQVSFLDIKQTFGMGNIRIGSWVTREEKDIAANLVFDALADLAYILALPPTAMGLRGQLNLAFGSGGQKGVQAHYAPYLRELALAKNAGAGALAHEFWHAYDHYITSKAFKLSPSHLSRTVPLFATDCWLKNIEPIAHPLNDRLMDIFKVTLLTEQGLDKHDYVTRSVLADQAIARQYYSLPTEMMARAFESVIESYSDIDNPYLVAGTKRLDTLPLYPDEDHKQLIFTALQDYFKPLGNALC